jgi:hypothetical protein
MMEIDAPPLRAGEEADVESEGGPTMPHRRKSQTPKQITTTTTATAKENEPEKKQIEIVDDGEDEDEDEEDPEAGDEETFAVEKILNHRIRKGSVTDPATPPPSNLVSITILKRDFSFLGAFSLMTATGAI